MPSSCSHYFRETIRGAERAGIDGNQLLSIIGLSMKQVYDPGWRGDVKLLARLVQLVWFALDDEFMGFIEHPTKPGTFAMMAHQLIHESSLKQAIRQGARFYGLLDRGLSMVLEESDDESSLSVMFRRPELDPQHYFIEFWLAIWLRLLGWLSGVTPTVTRVSFAYPRPLPYANELEYLFRCDHEFNSEVTALHFDAEYLNLPVIRSKAELKQFLSVAPVGFMVMPTDEARVEPRVRAILLANRAVPLHFPSCQEVAEVLNTTDQSIRRKLRQEGTSYRAIIENIRRDIATQKLMHTSLSVQEIAYQLGYSEARSFTRAFYQWTGASPGRYRKSLHEQFRSGAWTAAPD